ncbi:N-acetyltransferase [Robertmurraya yapensis]|uniref:N-acetyltransferase n=1 Tax=Bacillus yapensis TaxID=2492960 RepID=A0A3S0KRL2_9BACI|nr:GNAT family protein [Bacillus yapensis]RTR36210.1 N-acetyltransferase [Bacillus yapensis]TKT05713.1 GNAT family N-acetyltransferase [Bacillus yapensis]
MSELSLEKFTSELDDLVSFLTSEEWEFHSQPKPSYEEILSRYHEGSYAEAFWIKRENVKIGLLTIHDINDTIPSFDIRLGSVTRRKGFATEAIRWMIEYLFQLPDKKIRVEAYTRSDNIAMRKTLHKCGFVKEGYFRDAWEHADGSVSDMMVYSWIRRDWECKSLTPIRLEELPF